MNSFVAKPVLYVISIQGNDQSSDLNKTNKLYHVTYLKMLYICPCSFDHLIFTIMNVVIFVLTIILHIFYVKICFEWMLLNGNMMVAFRCIYSKK